VWETVLLQQFHDILPGSSIAWVHREAEANYARVAGVLEGIIERSLAALTGPGDLRLLANAAPVELAGVPALGVTTAPDAPGGELRVTEADGGWVVDTGAIRAVVDADGLIPSVRNLATGRELVAAGRRFGLLQLHNDRPSMYEAWDIDGHINRMVTDVADAESVRLVAVSDEAATFEVVRKVRASTIAELVRFTAGSADIDLDFDIDWHEQRTLLKLAFPTTVFTDRAASEIQFGHIHRPTYLNTTWDVARHETVAHRWVQVAEPGFGFAATTPRATSARPLRAPPSGCRCCADRCSPTRRPTRVGTGCGWPPSAVLTSRPRSGPGSG
jgi:alpha-mannosidase